MDDCLIENVHISWHDSKMRWFALFLACMFQMGNYYCYDFPAVLKDQIEEDFDITPFQSNLLYTVYSTPNIVLPLLGGVLLDIVGVRTGLIIFYIPLVLGQGLCFIGVITKNYTWMIVGRIMYGIGGENASVVQSTIVSKWFQGKELAFALGLNITISRLGSIINTMISPSAYKITNSLFWPILIGMIFLFASWLCGVGLAYMDKKCDELDKDVMEMNQNTDEPLKFSDVKEFKLDFWMLIVSCLISYTNLFVFEQNNIPMFKTLYQLSETQADNMYNIPYYMGAIFTPFMGFLIDRVGRRPMFLIISGVLIFFVDTWYLFLPTCSEACLIYPIIGQVILGLFYSFYAAVMWPCVPLCVPERTVGSAFGLTNALQNSGLAVGPLIVGVLVKDKTVGAYRNMMIFFTALAIVAIVDSIGLLLYDLIKNKGKLSRVDKMKMSKRSTIIKGGLDKSENYSMPKVYESGEEQQQQ